MSALNHGPAISEIWTSTSFPTKPHLPTGFLTLTSPAATPSVQVSSQSDATTSLLSIAGLTSHDANGDSSVQYVSIDEEPSADHETPELDDDFKINAENGTNVPIRHDLALAEQIRNKGFREHPENPNFWLPRDEFRYNHAPYVNQHYLLIRPSHLHKNKDFRPDGAFDLELNLACYNRCARPINGISQKMFDTAKIPPWNKFQRDPVTWIQIKGPWIERTGSKKHPWKIEWEKETVMAMLHPGFERLYYEQVMKLCVAGTRQPKPGDDGSFDSTLKYPKSCPPKTG